MHLIYVRPSEARTVGGPLTHVDAPGASTAAI
jgi:hypothetical protein